MFSTSRQSDEQLLIGDTEKLMGDAPGHTLPCWTTGALKADPVGYLDERLCLLGNGFCNFQVAWLLGSLSNLRKPLTSRRREGGERAGSESLNACSFIGEASCGSS